jgi:hypothetical protein
MRRGGCPIKWSILLVSPFSLSPPSLSSLADVRVEKLVFYFIFTGLVIAPRRFIGLVRL